MIVKIIDIFQVLFLNDLLLAEIPELIEAESFEIRSNLLLGVRLFNRLRYPSTIAEFISFERSMSTNL